MTQKLKNGGPAFPYHFEGQYDQETDGMSLRDYAVIQYTAAMIAHSTRYRPRDEDNNLHWHEAIALEAGDLADAMIAARK